MLGFKSFYKARRVLMGIELMQKLLKVSSLSLLTSAIISTPSGNLYLHPEK